jgi:aminoglycoside 6'-N-acetyltransferase
MAAVELRPATEADVPRLAKILSEPTVARWWAGSDEADVRENLEITFAVLVDGELAGLVLFSEETDPEYRHVGLDISLATRFQRRGIGPRALRLAIRHFAERGHHRFTIDPAADNEAAIRSYAKVGFKPVGVLREYERHGDDEPWHDGLLMDLLIEELRDS